ncbi:plancitoxin-1-like [Tubulanus polymorphus]|uniref:plancitoxin-1-like n=1 Tax=Tubulanus polymorphus TaxID=672921 RepID=UPI003DA6BDE9
MTTYDFVAASYVAFVVLLLSCSVAAVDDGGFSCKDPNGKNVSWFIVYKVPKLPGNKNKLIAAGLAHFYLDANNPSPFRLSPVSVASSSGHALANTLKQMHDGFIQKTDVLRLLMNDETPDKHKDSYHAHQKGVVLFNRDGGFWMVHSMPRFPNRANRTYGWPDKDLRYGQSFLCISMNSTFLDVIANLLAISHPTVYDFNLPKTFKVNAMFQQIAHNKAVPVNVTYKSSIITASGTYLKTFQAFSKSKKFNKDLYGSLVAPRLKANLRTETWQHGHRIPSTCPPSGYRVENIITVKLGNSIVFNSTHDHSKYAVGDTSPIVCIGDINRQYSQFHRGGGTVCIFDANVWRVFQSLILAIEKCPNHIDETLKFIPRRRMIVHNSPTQYT